MTRDEQIELAGLTGLAWEARDRPDFRAHVERIVDWHDRRAIRAYERRQRSTAAVLRLLRETDPERGRGDHVHRDDHRDVADAERAA